MIQNHPNCKRDDCGVCLDDCMRLLDELEKRIGAGARDYLGWYRKWWDDQGINSETEFGWPKPFVFDEINIARFVNEAKQDD